MNTGLQEKTAIITGASGGIGAQSARQLAAEGAAVVLTGRREERLLRTAEEIRSSGGRAAVLAGDLTDTSFCGALVRFAAERFRQVNILVCAAGMASRTPTLETAVPDWDEVMRINLTAPLLLSQACIRQFLQAGQGGKIIYISSTAGRNINLGASPSYGASKAGLLYLTRHLAREFASQHIYVNAICPGPVDTEITETWTPEHRARVLADLPVGRMGTPEDIANAVVYLAGSLSDYMTGESLLINGGRYMG